MLIVRINTILFKFFYTYCVLGSRQYLEAFCFPLEYLFCLSFLLNDIAECTFMN